MKTTLVTLLLLSLALTGCVVEPGRGGGYGDRGWGGRDHAESHGDRERHDNWGR